MEHKNDLKRKRNIIIAFPTPEFAEGLKKLYEDNGVNVLEVCVVIDHLIEKLEELKSDSSIKLDGLVISSAIATKLSDKRLEFLADVIEKIREDFSDTSIIFFSDETQGHPLLAELVSIGVYNIIVKSDQKKNGLSIDLLLRYIDQPMLYSEVKRYRDFNKDIPWRRFAPGGQSVSIHINNKTKDRVDKQQPSTSVSTDSLPEDLLRITSSNDEVKKQKEKNDHTKHSMQNALMQKILEEEMEDDIFQWQLPTIEKPKIIIRDRIVGKSVIAVAGVDHGVGTTHTAILIANFLASNGYAVKLIEYSGNQEFVNIERAYEGKNADTHKTDEFEINGVTYVKAGTDVDMARHVTSEHTHIVLDLGAFDDTEQIEEFHRASKQILVAPGGEWKQYIVRRFIKTNQSSDQSKWVFLIPLVTKQTINDIQGENDDISAYHIPFHPDPFRNQVETDEQLSHLFDVGETTRRKNKKIWVEIAIVIILVLIIFSIFR